MDTTNLDFAIESSWKKYLRAELADPYFTALCSTLTYEYQNTTVYPPSHLIFAAFNLCPFTDVRVVLLGQDPYHGAQQAHGLSFSVPKDVPIPPSLQNIQKEIRSDIGTLSLTDGNLTPWARQGVLLLNTTLTVAAGQPTSHRNLGWERFTDSVIRTISTKKTAVVFMLWGQHAINKRSLIDERKHLILCAPHPSPLSAYRGFFGCRHFSQANLFLQKTGQNKIEW